MDFLVEIAIDLPPSLPADDRTALIHAERLRGRELVRRQIIRQIWRTGGGGIRNVGIWTAADEDALRTAVASLPMFEWMTVRTTALHPHPLSDPAATDPDDNAQSHHADTSIEMGH